MAEQQRRLVPDALTQQVVACVAVLRDLQQRGGIFWG